MNRPALQSALVVVAAWELELSDHVSTMAGGPDRALVAVGSLGGDAVVVDAATGAEVARLPEHPMGVLSLAWSPDANVLAVGGQDGEVSLWERATGEVRRLTVGGWVGALSWCPAGRYLGIGAGAHLYIHDRGEDRLVERGRQPSTITGLVWVGREPRLGVAAYGGLRFFDPAVPGDEPERTLAFKGSLLCVSVSRDGRWVASGNQDATIHLWKLWDRDELEMHGYPSKITALSWDARSKLLASNGGDAVTVWDVSGAGPKGRTPAALDHHESPIASLAFQHRGSLLASTDAGEIALWRPHLSRRPLAVWSLDDGSISQVQWHVDDRLLLAAGVSGTCRAWTVTRRSA